MAGFPYNYSSNLPSGWEEKVSPEGRVFYLDHSAKKTQWNHPITGRRKKVVAGIPPGWEQLEGETGQPKFIYRAKNIITCIDPRLPFVLEDKEYEEDTKQATLNSNAPPTYKKATGVPEFVNPFTTNPFTRGPEKSLSPGQMGRFDAPFSRNPPNYGDTSRGGNYQSNRDNKNDYPNSRFDRNNSHNQGGWRGAGSRFGNQDRERNFSDRDVRTDRSGYDSNSGYGSREGDYGSMPNQRKWNESGSNQNPRFGNQERFGGYHTSQERQNEPECPSYKSDRRRPETGENNRDNNPDYFSGSKYGPPGKATDYSRDKWNEPESYTNSKPGVQSFKNDYSFNKGRIDNPERYSNSRFGPSDEEGGYPGREMNYGSRPNQGFRNESRDFSRGGGYRDERRGDFPSDSKYDSRDDTYGQNSDRRFGPPKNDSRESTWGGSFSGDRESSRPYQSQGQYSGFQNNPEAGSIKRPFDDDQREFIPKKMHASEYSGGRQGQYPDQTYTGKSSPYYAEGASFSKIQGDRRIGSDSKFNRPGNNDDSQQPSSDDAESHEEDEPSDDEEDDSEGSDADDNDDSNDDYEETQNEVVADDTPGPSGPEQNKKNIKKRRNFNKNAVVCKMSTVAITSNGFPRFSSLSRVQAEEVKDIIIRKIEELEPNDEISPRFSQANYRVGVLMVTCLDPHSNEWLVKTVNNLVLRDGTEIRVCSPKYVRNTSIICGVFPTDYHGEEAFLRQLGDENPGIDTSRWTVLQQFPMQGGICVSIGAPKTVVGDLHMFKYVVYFHSNPVKMGVVSKKNSGRRAPRGKLHRFIEETVLGLN